MCFLCRDVALDVGNKINLTFTFLHIMRLFDQQGKSILEITIGFVIKCEELTCNMIVKYHLLSFVPNNAHI